MEAEAMQAIGKFFFKFSILFWKKLIEKFLFSINNTLKMGVSLFSLLIVNFNFFFILVSSMLFHLQVSLLPASKHQRLLHEYHEYENRQTIESKVTKELDTLDLMIQAYEYGIKIFKEIGILPDVEEFFRHKEGITYPELISIRDEIIARKDRLFRKFGSLEASTNRAAEAGLVNGFSQKSLFSQSNPLRSNGYKKHVNGVINVGEEGHDFS